MAQLILSYAVITPARNEEKFIEKTIKSVISQTICPAKWVIVSDGSTDKTEDIVTRYLQNHDWIQLVKLPLRRDRQFAAKVNAFSAGYQAISNVKYDVIANLDADISFEKDYFEYLLSKFLAIPDLGVAGTPFVENGYSSISDSFEGGKHVAGGCQLFRRKCFEEIGGYKPVRGGGIDWIAVTTARMLGWKTISFPEKVFFHHRGLGTAKRSNVMSAFDYGVKDYFLGGHPVWECFRMCYRMAKPPYLIGGLATMAGYIWGALTRVERPVTRSLIRFHRYEQIKKLREILSTVFKRKRIVKYEQY
ncbi:MAG: glycosyltransferase family 2 protein [Desulfobacteraceae bacterium]|jgi:glycosyltransferase involved in cell wall biosynthesis|nr:MAG: glycosyltransferase family 2 protein [Desulfobacteraceae bacterium]